MGEWWDISYSVEWERGDHSHWCSIVAMAVARARAPMRSLRCHVGKSKRKILQVHEKGMISESVLWRQV